MRLPVPAASGDYMDSIKSNRGIPSHIPTFDTLRLLAIALVVIQHALSANKRIDLTSFHDLTFGQFGVAIFCMLSGFLAFRDKRPPLAWALRRAVKLFPAYWIVMLISFSMTWMSGYKNFGIFQFCSQMLGTGFFTHGWNLVNSPTWFFSLLLLCYAIVFIAKITRYPVIVLSLVSIVSVILIAVHVDPALTRHTISFNCAALVSILSFPGSAVVIAASAIILASLSFIAIPYVYSATALALLLACHFFPNWSTRGISRISPYIYEFFLVHGICFLGTAKIFKNSMMLSIPAGLLISIAAAWALKKSVTLLTRYISKIFKRAKI